MSERLKIGLVGAGVFAGYHANKLAAHTRTDFIGVFDPDAERARVLAAKHNVQTLSLAGLLKACDAVVIASPASTHGELALDALEAGCHCLIEKPIATDDFERREIASLASSLKLVIQIGHQERLILRAIGLDQIEDRPIKIEAVRNSPYSLRGTDTSVTMDLMTHDIDLCTALLSARLDGIEGEGACVRSEHPDMSWARLSYPGAVAHLEASRVAERSERRMKITYPSGVVEIDFKAKTLSHSTRFELNENFAQDARVKDSLGAATDIFVRAVLDQTPVLVTAADGAAAAHIASIIDGDV